MKEFLLNLNTRDAYLVNDQQIHSFRLQDPVVAGEDEQIMAHIHHASIPNSFYNIDSRNNSFTLSETVSSVTSTRTVQITPGNYSTKTLAAELAVKMSTVQLAGGAREQRD